MARKAMTDAMRSETNERAAPATQDNTDENDQHMNGRGWHGNPEGHAAAGRKGGSKVSQDREHMAEIGRRGGSKVAQDRQHMADIGRRGGAKVSQDRSHMAQIGKKGGESK